MSGYGRLIYEFAERTLRNLDFIQAQERAQALVGDSCVYPVTQLWNSLLGLVVLPLELDVRNRAIDPYALSGSIELIPERPMTELCSQGWPRITVEGPEHKSLRDLVRDLRNSVAHFNVKFLTGPDDRPDEEITSVIVWTQSPYKTKAPDYPGRPASDPVGRPIEAGHYYWQGQVKIEDLEHLAKLIAGIYLEVFV